MLQMCTGKSPQVRQQKAGLQKTLLKGTDHLKKVLKTMQLFPQASTK